VFHSCPLPAAAGTNLVLSSPAPTSTLASLRKVSLQECLKRCATSKGCSSARYNLRQDGGSCQLLQQQTSDLGRGGFSYDAAGWQSYHYAQYSQAQEEMAAAGR
jgi:hypothetical protein